VGQASAYRGAVRQQDPRFFGHDFGDAIDLAKKAADDFLEGKGKLLRYDIRAFGWPILRLRWHLPEMVFDAVLFVDGTGAVRAVPGPA
jgi:hypothetical protein